MNIFAQSIIDTLYGIRTPQVCSFGGFVSEYGDPIPVNFPEQIQGDDINIYCHSGDIRNGEGDTIGSWCPNTLPSVPRSIN